MLLHANQPRAQHQRQRQVGAGVAAGQAVFQAPVGRVGLGNAKRHPAVVMAPVSAGRGRVGARNAQIGMRIGRQQRHGAGGGRLPAANKVRKARVRAAVCGGECVVAVRLAQAHMPVHAGAGFVQVGLGHKGGHAAVAPGDLARQALEAEHRVRLRQRFARTQIHFVLPGGRLVAVARDRNALGFAGRPQLVKKRRKSLRCFGGCQVVRALNVRHLARHAVRHPQAALGVPLRMHQKELQLRRHQRLVARILQARHGARQQLPGRQIGHVIVGVAVGGAKAGVQIANHRGRGHA